MLQVALQLSAVCSTMPRSKNACVAASAWKPRQPQPVPEPEPEPQPLPELQRQDLELLSTRVASTSSGGADDDDHAPAAGMDVFRRIGLWCDSILRCCCVDGIEQPGQRPYHRMEIVPQESPSRGSGRERDACLQTVSPHSAGPAKVSSDVWICHIKDGRKFYRRRGDDASTRLAQPAGARVQTKKEIGATTEWFDERWTLLQKTIVTPDAPMKKLAGAAQAGRFKTARVHGASKVAVHAARPGQNMLAVAHDEFVKNKARVGYLIAGNAGKLGGGLHNRRNYGEGEGWTVERVRCNPRDPQEENSFRNFWHASKSGNVQWLMERQLPNWGMLDINGTGTGTRQGVNYAKPARDDREARRKYGHCIRIGEVQGYYQDGIQKSLQPWDERRTFLCDVYVTAGPQAKHPDDLFPGRGAGPTSSLRRTYDEDAHHDPLYLRECIVQAFHASLCEMDKNRVQVAVVPGLCTGVYAPSPAEGRALRAEMVDLLERALVGLSATHLQRVIYCGGVDERGRQHSRCMVAGCTESHSKHYCRVCQDHDSDHFASSCPMARNTSPGNFGGAGVGTRQGGQQHSRCKVAGCAESHSKHYCRVCQDHDSDHFASSCPMARKQSSRKQQ